MDPRQEQRDRKRTPIHKTSRSRVSILPVVLSLLTRGSLIRRLRWIRFVEGLRRWQTLAGALIGFAAVAFSIYAAGYEARKEERRHVANQCATTVSVLMTELEVVEDYSESASRALQGPRSTNPLGTIIELPPLDEELHEREADFALLDRPQIDAVLRTELYFHDLRSDLLGTRLNYNAGDTFGVANLQNRSLYGSLAVIVGKTAQAAIYRLSHSRECKAAR